MDDVTNSMKRITRYTEEMEKHHRLVLTAVNPDEAASNISAFFEYDLTTL